MNTPYYVRASWIAGLIAAVAVLTTAVIASGYFFVDVGFIGTGRGHISDVNEYVLPEWAVAIVVAGVLGAWITIILEYVALRHHSLAAHKAELDRARIQSQLGAFINESPSIISICDSDGRYVYVNRAWESFSGLTAADAVGKNRRDFGQNFSPSSIERFDVGLRDVIQNGQVRRYETTGIGLTGHQYHLHIVRFPLHDENGKITSVATIATDLTDQKNLAAAQQALEAQLRAFIDNGPFLVTMRDLDGRYLLCNRAWEEWAGVSEHEAKGKATWELFDDPTGELLDGASSPLQTFIRRIARDSATDSSHWNPLRTEQLVRRPNGDMIPMSSTHFPIRTADGKAIAVGSISLDVSDQWALRSKQQELQSLIAAFLDNAPIGVTLKGTDGRQILANNSFFKIAHQGTVHGRSREEIAALDREVIETGQVVIRQFEPTDYFPDMTVSAIKFPLRDGDGNINGVGTFLTDITEQRRSQRVMEESEARYRSMVELSANPILVYDGQTILFANETAASWFGVEASNLVGRDLLDFAGPDETATFKAILDDAAACSTGTFKSEIHMMAGRSAMRAVALSSSPVDFAGRRVRQLLIEDVSERKNMEAQMMQNAKLATIGELSAGILHELAQPLNIARLTAQAAMRGLIKGVAEGCLDPMAQFAMINSQIERMASVIEHMRVFSRSETSDEAVFDAGESVASAVKLVKDAFAADGIEIEASFTPSPVDVHGRRIALEQVLLNLLTNARDAFVEQMERDRQKVLRVYGKIRVVIGRHGDRVEITVTDNGGGISGEIIGRIFDPFFTTKPAGRGTGLGLSVCHSIVESMAGTIAVTNVEGGARFTIGLPAAGPAVADGDTDLDAFDTSPAVAGRIAMVVEDEVLAGDLLADFLEEMGFGVLSASDAPEALALCEETIPDLLISDIRLPGMDGFELAQRIRAKTANIPIIFVTGHFGITEEPNIFDGDPSVKLLHKPVDLVKLELAINELISAIPTKVLDAAIPARAA